MKKKKLFLILTLVLILILSGYIIPMTMVKSYPKVSLVNPYMIDISNDIHISGEVKEIDVNQVVTTLPVVPNDVLVKVGDKVEINQTIATIDKIATQNAIINFANMIINTSAYLPDITELLDIFENYGVHFEYENSQLVNVDLAKNNLSNQVEKVANTTLPTEIKATTDGVITSIDLIKGSVTSPQSVVCTISKTDELYVQLEINEQNISQIEVGDKVIFKAIATDDEKYQGIITTIFPTASKVYQGTTQKTIVGAYVELDETYDNLKAGYNITGVVKDSENEQTLILPYETIKQDENNNEYVYIYEQNRAIKQIITTGRELAQGVEIISGLNENSKVIFNSNDVKTHGEIVVGK